MSARLGPIKRSRFIEKLAALGFQGPFTGSRHEFMSYGDYDLHIPSYDEYSVSMHRNMIRQVEAATGRQISRDEWQRL